MSGDNINGMLPIDFKEIGPGIHLYSNILKKDLNISERIENVISSNNKFSWTEALVGYRQRVPGYRDCFDFKFKKSSIPGNDEYSLEIKNVWQDCFDAMKPAVDNYCKYYNVDNLDYWEAINLVKYLPGNQLSCEPYDWFFVSGILIHNK